MLSIIVAFPKIDDGRNMEKLLVRNGYEVGGVCTAGSQVIGMTDQLDGGVVLCGYRLSDMHYSQLNEYLPRGFEMLLMVSASRLSQCRGNSIICLGMPVKTHDLLNTLEMMTSNYNRWKKKRKQKAKERSGEEKETIKRAKEILIERNHMSEEEAHRYIQKTSMDNGINMVETAEMILTLLV